MNKLIVVTGGTKGIGRSIVERFNSENFDVVTCSRDENDLADLWKLCVGKNPATQVFTFKADLSVRAEVGKFCEFVAGIGKPVDVLVNNAGFFIPGQIISEPEDSLRKMIDANLYSAYDVTRSIVQLMLHGKSRYIFNMCSIASFMAYPNGGSYAISKFALLGFSKCLREELKEHGIRVSAVMPGATLTNSWNGTTLADERFMKPEDVAEIIYAAYALSDRTCMEEIILRPQLGDL
jgi:short-subunit dehydrogenase